MRPIIFPNERREIRRATRMACRVVRDKNFRMVADRTLDLSPAGMLVVTEHDVAIGEEMIVSFMATELGLWFDTMASVSRVVAGRRPTDKGKRALGLEFTSLSSVSRLILRGHLRKIPPPVPARPQPFLKLSRAVEEIDVDYVGWLREMNLRARPTARLTA